MHKAYHLVDRRAMYQRCADRALTAKEFDLRVNFSKRFYRGRYDRGHLHWMKALKANLTPESKLDMSLDACSLYDKL